MQITTRIESELGEFAFYLNQVRPYLKLHYYFS